MEPFSEVPLLSSSLGSELKTLGVYPRVAGGSPMASPISLCAIAKRVTESKRSITSFP